MSSLLPGSNQYVIPSVVTELRAFAALQAAGAWDAVADLTELVVVGASHVVIYGEYTRGAAGGIAELRPEVAALHADAGGAEIDWFPITTVAAGAVGAGADVTANAQATNYQYGAVTANREGFIISIDLPPAIERFRVNAREQGVVGNPGSLRIRAIGVI